MLLEKREKILMIKKGPEGSGAEILEVMDINGLVVTLRSTRPNMDRSYHYSFDLLQFGFEEDGVKVSFERFKPVGIREVKFDHGVAIEALAHEMVECMLEDWGDGEIEDLFFDEGYIWGSSATQDEKNERFVKLQKRAHNIMKNRGEL